MSRKTLDITPEPTQAELEEAQLKHTRVLHREKPQAHRHRKLTAVPHDEVPSRDFCQIVMDTLEANADTIGIDTAKQGWADNWATILLRDVRYGIPYEELQGEGFPILEDNMGQPPMCDECQGALDG